MGLVTFQVPHPQDPLLFLHGLHGHLLVFPQPPPKTLSSATQLSPIHPKPILPSNLAVVACAIFSLHWRNCGGSGGENMLVFCSGWW